MSGTEIIIPSGAEDIVNRTDSRCAVVKAAPGFGKSAVISALLADEDVRWIRLDITFRDPDRLSEQMNAVGSPAYIVLDDVQELGNGESLAHLLVWIRSREDTRIILITNRELPMSLRMMVLKGEAVLFDESTFILTPEVLADSRLRTEDDSVSEDADSICDELPVTCICGGFGGWSLGVTCTLKWLSEQKNMGQVDPNNNPDCFWTDVLEKTGLSGAIGDIFLNNKNETVIDVLKVAALLGEFSMELCRAVTLFSEFSDQEFREAVSTACVCRPIHDGQTGDGWYRISEAFAVFLSTQLKPSEKKQICAATAAWYRDHGDYAQMTAYALRGGEEGLLIEALVKNGVSLLTGRVALGQIVTYLEGRQVSLPPEAAGVVAQYHYLEGRLDRAERYLNEADVCFGKENRYSAYRSLYRALKHYEEDAEKYKKQIRSAVFFLKEADEPFPRLTEEDENRLSRVMRDESGSGSLRVTTFGRFAVTGEDGKELAWRTKKGRELFAYLLDIEGGPVDRRQLMETLWPEEIPENAVAMLHNMIYNIRKELSDYRLEKLITYESKHYLLNMDEIESDSLYRQRLAGYVKRKDIEELIRNADAFLIYPGRYLDDIDNTWATEKREYYDGIYRTGCELLAEHFEDRGETDRAIQLYGNILLTDPYSESTVEKLIRLYGERREWEKMKRCYEEFKSLLKRDLGVRPEEKLEMTYRSFRAG